MNVQVQSSEAACIQQHRKQQARQCPTGQWRGNGQVSSPNVLFRDINRFYSSSAYTNASQKQPIAGCNYCVGLLPGGDITSGRLKLEVTDLLCMISWLIACAVCRSDTPVLVAGGVGILVVVAAVYFYLNSQF